MTAEEAAMIMMSGSGNFAFSGGFLTAEMAAAIMMSGTSAEPDEYYTVTIIPIFDYYDPYSDTVLTDQTFQQAYNYQQKFSSSNNPDGSKNEDYSPRYGSLGNSISNRVKESCYYVAYDESGNVADCTNMREYFDVAEVKKTETRDDCTIEWYRYKSTWVTGHYFYNDVTIYPPDGNYYYSYYVRAVKNIESIDKATEIFNEDERWHVYNNEKYNNKYAKGYALFILKTGEIYVFEQTSSLTHPFTYEISEQVGMYDYDTDTYSFTDESFYRSYILQGYSYATSLFENFFYTWEAETDFHPMLKLKKGTYTIKQISSSTGCDLMEDITIEVTRNMTLTYKTTIHGGVIKAKLVNLNEHDIILSNSTNTSWLDKWYVQHGTYGSYGFTTYTYRLSDYALQFKQTAACNLSQACFNIPSGNNDGIMNYHVGCHMRTYYVYNGTNSDGSEYTSYSCMMPNIYSPTPLTDEEAAKYQSSTQRGIYINTSTGTVSLEQALIPNWGVDFTGSEYWEQFPTFEEVESVIASKSIDEWFTMEDEKVQVNDYFSIYFRGLQYAYGSSGSLFGNTMTYTMGTPASLVNTVKEYWKADDADAEEYNMFTISDSIYQYENYGQSDQYCCYDGCTILSPKITTAWDSNTDSEFRSNYAHQMFQKQLQLEGGE